MNNLDEKTVARFWAKVNKEGPVHPTLGTKCWLWTACLVDGYGYFRVSKKMSYAHKFSYELSVGEVPDGLQLDHLCRNRHCVRQDHLEPVTCRENLLRGKTLTATFAAKTHCPQGHPYSGSNLYMHRGGRHCSECMRSRALAAYYRKRAGKIG